MEQPSPHISPLAVAALALLVEAPMHPYEMYQEMLKRKDDRLVKVRPGSLYHTIDRLARHGLAEVAGIDRGGNRPERTTYRVTDAGRTALEQRLTAMLREPADEYPEFPLALSQAHNLPAEEAVRLLETRIGVMQETLAALGLSAQHVQAREIPEKFWIEVGYQRAVLRAELDWLEQLLERITTGRLDW